MTAGVLQEPAKDSSDCVSDHENIESSQYLVKSSRTSIRLLHWTSGGQILACLGDLFREFLGK